MPKRKANLRPWKGNANVYGWEDHRFGAMGRPGYCPRPKRWRSAERFSGQKLWKRSYLQSDVDRRCRRYQRRTTKAPAGAEKEV